ncbi:hypothetical protein [Pseudomonas protegens]|uniref:hypothetical protein n=1 Tax=Pseudomonas protegens TaxID=380021 RepID=UPI001B3332D9|nr:hypothetical protein [Pseudomonas protegens]
MSWKMTAQQRAEQEAKLVAAIDAVAGAADFLSLEIAVAKVEGRLQGVREHGLPAAACRRHTQRLQEVADAARGRFGREALQFTAAESRQLTAEALR